VPIKFDRNALKFGFASFACGLLLFITLEWSGLTTNSRVERLTVSFLKGGLNVASGATMYWLWKTVPCKKFKDDDLIIQYSEYK
jgi:hypothetical protein